MLGLNFTGRIRRENLNDETKLIIKINLRPLFYYFGRGEIKTEFQHPFYPVEIITNDGRHGGTNLIMTEGVLENDIKILIKKGLIEKGLNKKVTGRFYRYGEEEKINPSFPPLSWSWNIVKGGVYTIDYLGRAIIVRKDADKETLDTLLSLANGRLETSFFGYLENETELGKIILP